MSSCDTPYLERSWAAQYMTPSPQTGGSCDTDLIYWYAIDQQLAFTGIPANHGDGLNFEAQLELSTVGSLMENSSSYYPVAFPYQSSDFTGRPDLRSTVKPVPRVDTQIIDALERRYDPFSASTLSWSPSSSSVSNDAEIQQYGSPQSSTQSDYSLIHGLSYHHDAGPVHDSDGRHLSESNELYFKAMIQTNLNVPTCATISPEILRSSFAQQSDLFDDVGTVEESSIQLKTQVATDRVLSASRKRRGQIKPGARLLHCELCRATFTARHNLTNHINSHYGRKPYLCITYCGRAFGTKHVLRRHQRTCQTFLRCDKM